jgi:peptide/nickel transport system substrate-binding protein
VRPATPAPVQLKGGARGKVEAVGGVGVHHVLFNFADPRTRIEGVPPLVSIPHPFLADKAVRKALILAINRRAIGETVYGPAGTPTAALLDAPASVLPPGQAADYEYDRGKAARALDAAGWTINGRYRVKNTTRMEVLCVATTDEASQHVQRLVQDALEQIGVATMLKSIQADRLFPNEAGSTPNAEYMRADLVIWTSTTDTPDTPDTHAYLTRWATTVLPGVSARGQFAAWSGYANREYDTLVARIGVEIDPSKRAQQITRALEILHEDAVTIPLVARKRLFAHASSLGGLAPSPWTGLTWNMANWFRT